MNAVLEVNPKGWYPIGQAAAALGIDRSTLRRKTKEGVIRCSFRRDTGRKVYRGAELIRYHEATL